MKKMNVKRVPIPDDYYTVAEIAEILHVTTRTVHTYLHVDGLPYKKSGRYNIVSKNDLSDWLLKQSGQTLEQWKKNSD